MDQQVTQRCQVAGAERGKHEGVGTYAKAHYYQLNWLGVYSRQQIPMEDPT